MLPLTDFLKCKLFPWATLTIIAMNVFVFIGELIAQSSGDDSAVTVLALVPGNFTHAFQSGDPSLILFAITTLFTAMFLHGGLEHIIGNMIFLFAFGRSMEARLGHARFVWFYLIGGLAAGLLQTWWDPTSMQGIVGASGAIAGVLGGYIVLWPRIEILCLVMGFIPARIKAYWVLGFWFLFQQLLPVIKPILHLAPPANDHIAYFEHIGGFACGLLIAFLIQRREPTSENCYVPTDCAPCDEKHEDVDSDQHH